MFSLPPFDSLDEAFVAILDELTISGRATERITDVTSIGSRFGTAPRATTELVAVGFSLRNPRSRWLASEARALNRAFALANTLWTFSGSNRAEDIAPYNSRGKAFSRSGILEGAVGHRIFNSPVGDQLSRVIDTLRAYPASRRAVVQVYSTEDLATAPLDTPCTISLQYLVRDGRLEAITSMRSQSAALLLPYDVFLFSMLQEVVASELGLILGAYHHFCGSLHYYEDEAPLVSKIVANPAGSKSAMPMPPMPKEALVAVKRAVEAETDLRRRWTVDPTCVLDVGSYSLDPYWQPILETLKRALVVGGE